MFPELNKELLSGAAEKNQLTRRIRHVLDFQCVWVALDSAEMLKLKVQASSTAAPKPFGRMRARPIVIPATT